MKALAEAAIDAAVGAGASYADARAVSLRRQYVITKNGQVDDLSDGESEGIGVRVLGARRPQGDLTVAQDGWLDGRHAASVAHTGRAPLSHAPAGLASGRVSIAPPWPACFSGPPPP